MRERWTDDRKRLREKKKDGGIAERETAIERERNLSMQIKRLREKARQVAGRQIERE